jgi:predicted outer membrane repeat protein
MQFVNNSYQGSGAAVSLGSSLTGSTISFESTIFHNNTATYYGGAVGVNVGYIDSLVSLFYHKAANITDVYKLYFHLQPFAFSTSSDSICCWRA